MHKIYKLNLLAIIICFMIAAGSITASSGYLSRDNSSGVMQITTKSDEARKLYLEATTLRDNFRRAEARELLEKALKLDPDFALGHLEMYTVERGDGNSEKTIEHLKEAVRLSDKASEGERSWIKLVEAYTFGPRSEFEKSVKKVNSLLPNDRRVQFQIGSFYYVDGDYKKAISHFQKALAADSSYAAVYNMLGYSYAELNNFDESQKAFKKYIELLPNDPNPIDSYAEMLLRFGHYDESIGQYNEAIKLSSAMYSSIAGIGHNYLFKGDYNKARDYYKRELDNSSVLSDKYDALYFQAASYLYEGNYNDALKAFEKYKDVALSSNDFLGAMFAERSSAFILYENGNYDEAVKHIENAEGFLEKSSLPVNSKQIMRENAQISMSINMALKGDLADAQKKLAELGRSAFSQKGGDNEKYYNTAIGILALKQNKFDKAVKYFSGGDINDPVNWYYTATAYQKKNDMNNAHKWMDRIAKSNKTSLELGLVRQRANEMLSSK